MDQIALTRILPGTLSGEHICCAIGDDKENKDRAATKKSWLARRLSDGHVFLKADVRGKAFIEFGPAELEWFPIDAPGWLFAQCFWVAGKYAGTGLGARLLAEAERDAEARSGLCFLAAAKGKLPFLTEGRFLSSMGYEIADEALGFALFAKPARRGVALPRFSDGAREGRLAGSPRGLDLFWSAQCPFAPHYSREMAAAGESMGLPARLHEVDSLEKARSLRAPPGVFQAYLDGRFLTHELMTQQKFAKLLETAAKAGR